MRSCNFKFTYLISTVICDLNVLLRERKSVPPYERWLINLKWGPASLRTGTFFSSLTRSHVKEDRRERLNSLTNRPFYRYGGHIEFSRFKEYYGMPWGYSLRYSRAFFGQKENFNVYFSAKRRSLLHPNTAQRSFFPLQSFSRKLKEKSARKARVNTDASISDRTDAPWASWIFLKSN